MIGNFLLYYVIILPLSTLPYWAIYGVSNFTFYVLFYGFGYRKKVVYTNLKNSFPDKSDKEIDAIAKKFFRHLCDLIVESIKIFSISKKQVSKRMVIKNPELVNQFYDQGRSVILVGGHYNSWELYAVAVDQNTKHKSIAIYKELRNKFWDQKMRDSRQCYGLSMIDTKTIGKVFEDTKDELTATIFATDQSPSNAKRAHWMEFLNQDTAVLFGTERYAKKYNMPVIYGRMDKVKRGHYEVTYQVVTDDPLSHPEGEITELHTRVLEQIIREKPQYWLWSHKRWKRKRSELDE